MKRLIPLFISGLVLALLATGCASVDKAALATMKNTALISVYCDKKVDTSDFGLLASAINQAFQSDAFDMKPAVNNLRDMVFKDYAPLMGITMADERTVLGTDLYKKYVNDRASGATQFALPDGYTLVSVLQADDYKALAAAVPGCTGAIVLQATYKLSKYFDDGFGGGIAKVKASIMFVLKDASGKDLVSCFGFGESVETLPFALGGLFDASKLKGMCDSATKDASNSLTNALKSQLK